MINWSLSILRQSNPLSGIDTVRFQKIQINKIGTVKECSGVVEASVGIFIDLSISKREKDFERKKDFDFVDVDTLFQKVLASNITVYDNSRYF